MSDPTSEEGTPQGIVESPGNLYPKPFPEWRRMDAEAQSKFLDDLNVDFPQRLRLGEKTYQSHLLGFQGDAWLHTWEEALDTVVDLFWLGREVQHLRMENSRVMEENEELKEENRLLKEGPGA